MSACKSVFVPPVQLFLSFYRITFDMPDGQADRQKLVSRRVLVLNKRAVYDLLQKTDRLSDFRFVRFHISDQPLHLVGHST